jgi:hypothetical protein
MSSKIHVASNKPSQPLDWSQTLERGPDESLRWTFDGQEGFLPLRRARTVTPSDRAR